MWDILHIYLLLDVVCGGKKNCIFFSLCYNKLWQPYRDSFITSAVNVANVQTDGRKTVFFSSFRQYGSSFTSRETWLQVLQLKWNGGEKTGKTKRRENISCLTMPHLAARFCPLESVSDSLARNMAGQQLVGVHFVAPDGANHVLPHTKEHVWSACPGCSSHSPHIISSMLHRWLAMEGSGFCKWTELRWSLMLPCRAKLEK